MKYVVDSEREVGKLVSARDTCREALIRFAQEDATIMCLDSDMGGLESRFGANMPSQYLDVGIAEANMISIAAGLARGGCKPVAHTMATFAATRACEQMKLDVAHHDLPVIVVATHGGFSAGHYGQSHFCLEDIAILRSFPNMTVIVPSDAHEAELALQAALDFGHPVYIRLGRKPTKILHGAGHTFQIGKAQALRAGDDVTIIAAGPYAVACALEAADALVGEYFVRVINSPTVKPFDSAVAIAAARETAGIVTIEEHMAAGGLGSIVAETVTSISPCPVHRIGVLDVLPKHVGDEESLLAQSEISTTTVVAAIRRMLVGTRYRPG